MVEKRLIIALDFNNSRQALDLVDNLDPNLCRVKVGKELFTASGPKLIKEIISKGFDVFLDLKFHDIPNTVAKAVSVAADLGVWMVNLHTSGGMVMMEAAKKALDAHGAGSPLLVGVTVLTSLSKADLLQIGIRQDLEEHVISLALLARDSGLDGVVCSASEARLLRAKLPKEFCLVTPGIRRIDDGVDDQKRVVGPVEAIRNGSDYLVIGRPITRAESPFDSLIEFNSAITGIN